DTVTQKVTPDPSVPGENPLGTPGWLDTLANSLYNTQRIGAAQATGSLAIANTTSNTYGPFVAGTYHVKNPVSSAGYSNVSSLTIVPSATLGITSLSNTTPIVVTTASPHGLSGSEIIYITGALGNTGANGFWSILVTGANTFSLLNSAGTGAYTSGAL